MAQHPMCKSARKHHPMLLLTNKMKTPLPATARLCPRETNLRLLMRLVIPSVTCQCDDEASRLQSNIDGEQLLPLTFLDALPTAEDLGAEKDSSLGPSVQGRQTPVDLDVSYLLGSLSDVRSLPGIWTHEYQMGPENFWAQSPSAVKIIQGLANSNSSFSDHMQMIKACLKKQWRKATQLRAGIETPQVMLPSCGVMD